MIWGKDPKSNHLYKSDGKRRNNWWCCEKILIILLGQVCYMLGSASTYYNNETGWTCSVFHISVCERGQGGRHSWPSHHPCHHHASSVPDNTPCLLLLIGRRKGGPSQVSAVWMHWGGSRFGYLYTDLTVGYHIAFYGANFRHQLIFLTSPAAKWIPHRHTNRIRAENSLGKGN